MAFGSPRQRYTGLTLDSLPDNPGLMQPAQNMYTKVDPGMSSAIGEASGRITPDPNAPIPGMLPSSPLGAPTNPADFSPIKNDPAIGGALADFKAPPVAPASAASAAPQAGGLGAPGVMNMGMMGAGLISKGLGGQPLGEDLPPQAVAPQINSPNAMASANMMQQLLNQRKMGLNRGGLGGMGGMGGPHKFTSLGG